MEVQQALGELVETGEVVRSQDFSLDDGEVDLDLIEPTGVDWTMDERQAREQMSESVDGSRAPVGTPVVNDPEDTAGVVVGRACHDLFHQAIKGRDARSCFATAKDAGMMNIESGDVRPCAATIVFVLNKHRTIRRRRQRCMVAPAGLDAGLFVSGDDKFVTAERLAIPAARIQIQYSPGLGGKGRVTRKDPAAVTPRTNRVLMEPPPDGAARDTGNQTGMANLSGDVGGVPTGNGDAMSGGQFASQGLNLNYQFWGEKPGGDRGGSALPTRSGDLQRNVFAKD